MAEEDVITQVAPPSADRSDLGPVSDLPETVVLIMRGHRFEVKRERLLSLPESILFGISSGMTAAPFGPNDEPDTEAMDLDFSPECFEYILKTLDDVDTGIKPVPVTVFKAPKPWNWNGNASDENSDHLMDESMEDDNDSIESLPWLPLSTEEVPEVLKKRPSLIVLREDLEYYVLNKSTSDSDSLGELKDRIGDAITKGDSNRHIFNGLRNRNTLDSPEYHLMQMLVLAGLSADQLWAFRDREKRTSQILSLQMAKIKLPPNDGMIEHIYALQKLLLFWRKPAKKCWWDKVELEGQIVHVRRVWTLELTIVGLTV